MPTSQPAYHAAAVDTGSPGSTDRTSPIAPPRNDRSAVTAAGTVHDLGNLIQIAASAINIVAGTPNLSADHARVVFARARSSLEQAGALVRQTVGMILDRSPAGEHSSVAACIADVIALVDGIWGSPLTLEVDVEPDLPDVRCDPLGLRNALVNLILNARDAMGGRGTVLIEAVAVWGGVYMVELRVTDTGVGMSPATIERAFDLFFTTKSDGLGGVGLPMVDRFIRDAGGEVSIESEPGVGTTVSLRLPMLKTGS